MSDTKTVATPRAPAEASAADALLSLVYEELRKLAADRMAAHSDQFGHLFRF